MIEEMDREAVRMEVNRLPLEVRKAGDAPPPAATSEPKVADAPPAMKETPTSKAEPPIANPITTAGNRAQKDAFTPFTRTSAIKGTITNRGQNAVDAEKTPLGVYMRGVTGAVEKKWHVYRRLKQDAVTFGSLRVRFFVTRDGTPEDLKIISDPRDADPRMADFTLRAIKDAEIPPIPEDLLPMLDSERVKIEYDVLIY
jgi:outer membrane biosynthesis protein TonB